MTLQDFQVGEGDLSEAILSEYLQSPAIAVDTETMGLLPQRDRLCLVQVCNTEGQVTAIRISRGQRVAPNLKVLMEATDVVKVFHFARFDVATLKHNLDIVVRPIFCTKIASKLARTYTNRHGLKDVVLELEKVELDKSSQCSDWGNASSLSDIQLSYAANDVRYLLSVREKLTAILKREERWQVAQECFQVLPTIVSLDLLQFKDLFEH
ncbi:MAG: ribonuclease D [Aphanizomenon flos-aquae LD13]|jgi:ribonuclease D|uniref:Ribonuclease D n=1 Tax=Aphanizomenon flos-aquae LD13 TaxID=1710894 RepID=A0A1B7VYK3_APHFL|nr:ribonuclease D [Aphanizomenon flos-aquae UKL13-PB]MBO1061620.1 ribonuclease D [Aphanizomenon flos-aquae CP01]OBQ26062.1 MAG: ribonuclease D [Aphanizomenon flos-aquae LD13]HCQ22568.1 ribonuclease D [Anabaena sp. UBA12330]